MGLHLDLDKLIKIPCCPAYSLLLLLLLLLQWLLQ